MPEPDRFQSNAQQIDPVPLGFQDVTEEYVIALDDEFLLDLYSDVCQHPDGYTHKTEMWTRLELDRRLAARPDDAGRVTREEVEHAIGVSFIAHAPGEWSAWRVRKIADSATANVMALIAPKEEQDA